MAERIRLRCSCFWDVQKDKARLIDKWEGMQFAQRHGVAVPQLYWHGHDALQIPTDLPRDCVIKGSRGYNARRVYLINNGKHRCENPLTLKQIRMKLNDERVSEQETYLVQELVTTDGTFGIPLEYQFHMFGSVIGAIQFVDENEQTHRFYDANGKPFEFRVGTHREDSPVRPPPNNFAVLCEAAIKLGTAYGTFVRVDFLQTQTGFVFSEFCATPMGGACYTPEADAYFDRLWEQYLSDSI